MEQAIKGLPEDSSEGAEQEQASVAKIQDALAFIREKQTRAKEAEDAAEAEATAAAKLAEEVLAATSLLPLETLLVTR